MTPVANPRGPQRAAGASQNVEDAPEANGEDARLVGALLAERWRVERLVGAGGMSSVYAATHRNGKRVALKVLKNQLAASPAARRRFLREGYIANRVNHRGVVSVLDDVATDDGVVFLVMDLIEGQTIEDLRRARGGTLAPNEVAWLAEEVLDVLVAAHAAGVVHRDVKPANVLLSVGGEVKLLDFGVARLRELSEFAEATQSGMMLGTPAFMAPEQARGRWSEVDARTDVWAVGATMFRLLSGLTVHEDTTPSELMIQAATSPAPALGGVCRNLPPSLLEVVDRALRLSPSERWQTAREMQAALHSARRDLPALEQWLLPLPNTDSNTVSEPASGSEQPARAISDVERLPEAQNRRASRGWLFVLPGLLVLAALGTATIRRSDPDSARAPGPPRSSGPEAVLPAAPAAQPQARSASQPPVVTPVASASFAAPTGSAPRAGHSVKLGTSRKPGPRGPARAKPSASARDERPPSLDELMSKRR